MSVTFYQTDQTWHTPGGTKEETTAGIFLIKPPEIWLKITPS